MKIRLVIAVLLSAISISLAQTDSTIADGEFSIIRTKVGVKIVFNSLGASLLLDIKCSSFKQIESENMLFVADSVLMQITPVPISFLFKKDMPELNDSAALIYHMGYEMKNIRNTIRGTYQIKPELVTSDMGRLIGFWSFTMPRVQSDTASMPVVGQMYATTRAGNKIFMLSCALTSTNEPDKVKKMLIESISSVIQFPIMIDIDKIREQLMKEEENSTVPDQG